MLLLKKTTPVQPKKPPSDDGSGFKLIFKAKVSLL